MSHSENAVTLCMKMNGFIYQCFLDKLNVANVNSFDGDENSLLHLAVKLQQRDLCRALLNVGANIESINERGNTPLFEFLTNTNCQHVTDNVTR